MSEALYDEVNRIKSKGIIYEYDQGQWDIKVDFPKYGVKGKEWKVKTNKKVNEISVRASNDLIFDRVPSMSLGGTPKRELMFGSLIIDVTGKDTDEVKGEWKTGRNFNGKFQNLLLTGDYLFEINITGNEANEQVTIKMIIPIVETEDDLKNVEIPKSNENASYDKNVNLVEVTNDCEELTEDEYWYV